MSTRTQCLIVLAVGLSCKPRGHSPVGEPDAERTSVTLGSTFDLRVETDRGSSVFVFRFPDQSSRRPAIVSLSIGKDGARQAWCELDALDVNGELIEERWVAAVVPKNYRAVGCVSKSLSPGDYEVALFTQRGEFRRRLTVDADGLVQVRPWEDD